MPARASTTARRRTTSQRTSWREPAPERRRYRTEMPADRPAVRIRPAPRLKPHRWLALAMAGIIAFALGQLLANDVFYVYQMQITGNRFVSESEIFDGSGVAGYNIFWVKPQEVAATLMSHPYIKSAKVVVGLPNRVRIHIVEREPRLAWDVNGEIAWVDAEGMVLPRREGSGDLVTLVDAGRQAALDEGHLRPAIVTGALEIHRLLPDAKVFQYAQTFGLHFQLPGGTMVYLGDEQDMPEKVALLNALRQKLAADKVQAQLIDLRYRGSPYYR
jgi:cell division septal protein FtsQ